jgi:putative transposase
MIYPLVTDLAADGVPVAVTCRVLGFSKQGYYRWRASPVTERDWVDAHLVNAARDIHAEDPAFGYRFIADELPEKASWRVRTGSSACAGTTASGRCSPRSGA